MKEPEYELPKVLELNRKIEAEREDYETEGPGATLRGLGSVFAHFFTQLVVKVLAAEDSH